MVSLLGNIPRLSDAIEFSSCISHGILFPTSLYIYHICYIQSKLLVTIYKQIICDPDHHDGVITHLEPDISECKVKRALGSITTNKANGGDRIPVELFQVLKDDFVKVLHSICQYGKLSSGHRTGKGQFSLIRRAVPKNVQTTA